MTYTIAAFYRFTSLPEPNALGEELRGLFNDSDLRGTMLIAGEGVNGTLAGSAETIDHLLDTLVEKVGLDRQEVKFSSAQERPFKRLKFQVKPEIISFRKAKVDPTQSGQYVEPREWNALIADGEVLLLDTRNHYETDLGTFAGATAPGTETFSDFVTYVRQNLDPAKHRKIAMFCTGGIRCEKASAFMLQEGFDEIYHLKGGILKYLEEVPQPASKWQGKCYIFDRRTSVGHADFED
ncbi:rhodanese-related sulfurtransferase [Granulicella sp. dw_53]|uniref:oxygen-dependent tRNA uridine(34) hydroxylase TrhO n=1 Tax=Granulicella sp. dw_53 TaxID=2719792 RepID=UPI001BD37E7E